VSIEVESARLAVLARWIRPALTDRHRTLERTILLAEDNAAVRRVAGEVLTRRGYRVLSASSGQDALKVAGAADRPIHVLVADLVMPEMDGYELYERLAARHPDLRVLFMTGHVDEQMGRRQAGGRGVVLRKPFAMSLLVQKVDELLGPVGHG
jgi:CheY-like chemotaxis protein